MSATMQRQDQGYRPLEPTPGAAGGDPGLGIAKAFLIMTLAWACLVLLSWLGWWQAGDAGREAIAGTVGLSAAQLTL